jgi:hypothetical protein
VGDLLETASAFLADQRRKHLSRTVTYCRGANRVEVAATVGRTVFTIDTETAVQAEFESRDFLVLTADLVLGGVPTLPQAGDQIREPSGGKVFVYAVLAPGDAPAWRYSDPYRKTLRIHTKQVAEE